MIEYGIKNEIRLIELIKVLRNNIGAHSTGKRVSKRKELKKATILINELFGREINVKEVENYILSVDTVLMPMKNLALKFIKELEDV